MHEYEFGWIFVGFTLTRPIVFGALRLKRIKMSFTCVRFTSARLSVNPISRLCNNITPQLNNSLYYTVWSIPLYPVRIRKRIQRRHDFTLLLLRVSIVKQKVHSAQDNK